MQIIHWNPWVLKLMVYFVSCANDKPSMFRNIPIQRGQLLRSIPRIIDDLKYPVEQMSIDKRERYHEIKRRTLERYLDYMVKVANLIDKKMTQVGLLITVKDYDALCQLPLKQLALLDSEEVAYINKGKKVHISGNMLMEHARQLQRAYGDEKAMAFCKQQRMSPEDIERALHPVPIPADLKATLRRLNER